MGLPETDPLAQLSLPPGFRFYPTDEELLVQYLCRKVAGHHFSLQIIGEIDLYKFNPWDLPSKAMFGDKEWYFFSPRDRKYPNGSRPNRVARSGYWKATGTDKVITAQGAKVGIKKALVFYVGKAPKGAKTNWIMHEYRLIQQQPSHKNGSSKLDEWVLCRIYKKKSSADKVIWSDDSSREYSNCSLDGVLDSLPCMDDQFLTLPSSRDIKEDEGLNFQDLGIGSMMSWSTRAGLNSNSDLVNSQSVNSRNIDGFYVPSIPPLCNAGLVGARSTLEEEFKSQVRAPWFENHGF